MSANRSSPDRVYLGGVRVLLVDSSQSIREVVTAMLEDYGASVTAVGTADEALEVLERERTEPASCAPGSSTTSRSRSPRTTSPGSSRCWR
jgi:hypothetical protein